MLNNGQNVPINSGAIFNLIKENRDLNMNSLKNLVPYETNLFSRKGYHTKA